MTVDLQQKKLEILDQVIQVVPTHGWSNTAMEDASTILGYDKHYASLLFIGGVNEVLDFYLHSIDEKMLSGIQAQDLTNLRIPERIYEAIVMRLNMLSKHKDTVKKTISFLSLPWNMTLSMKFAWRTMDLIWYKVCKDQSHDFNYYTKRALLLSVYSSTLLYWIGDTSEEFKNTKQFLINRLKDIASFGKIIQKAKKCI